MSRDITLHVNGERGAVPIEDTALLLDVLRNAFGVTSVREGCGVGACGACTVLAGGQSVSSCLALASRYEGEDVRTADGLPDDDPVISAFVDSDAMQCGYCIPGFVLMAKELLSENPEPTEDEIRDHLEGNICRCAAYPEILRAVSLAAARAKAAD